MRKKQRKKKKTEKQKKITNCKCASFYVLGLVSLINKAWYRKGKKQKHFTKFTKGGDVCFCVWTFHVATELSVIRKLRLYREILEESQKGIDVNIIGYGGWEVNDIMIPNMISFAVKIRVREQRAVWNVLKHSTAGHVPWEAVKLSGALNAT